MFGKGIKVTAMAALFVIFSATALTSDAEQKNNTSNCCQAQSIEHFPSGNCQAKAANQSWFSWLTGKSRSSQFHYLDLLELLESNRSDEETNYAANIR